MKLRLRRCALVLSFAAVVPFAVAQRGETIPPSPAEEQTDVRLPNGKVQRDEILKAEREQNLKDAARLAGLAEQLRQDLEKNDRFVLSISTLKKTDEIEKLAKKIRSRLRHD
jgi:hypothetical protein